jgi:2,3-bisphosphoglycerate-dependent phosphoglycerate mutase
MPKRLIFVRHAESELSARGLVNGDPAMDCPLTLKGRLQAEELHRGLVRDPVDLCVVSEFPRAQETAVIALTGLNIPWEIDPGLNDPPLGVFESKPEDEYVGWLATHDWSRGPEGGGESQLGSVRRFLDSFERLLARAEASVLVIGHAFPTGVARTLAQEAAPMVRPHYDCAFDYVSPVEIDPAALAEGIKQARRELLDIERS